MEPCVYDRAMGAPGTWKKAQMTGLGYVWGVTLDSCSATQEQRIPMFYERACYVGVCPMALDLEVVCELCTSIPLCHTPSLWKYISFFSRRASNSLACLS